MDTVNFPELPEISRNGNAGLSRTSRAPYKGAGKRERETGTGSRGNNPSWNFEACDIGTKGQNDD
ncbi:MAG: hypothetical protein KGI54_12645 [Pseudomonadota bacterium]|nr:hypothetical protein [Pseudomonadota bacterium]